MKTSQEYTPERIAEMSAAEAEKIGVQQFRDGKTFRDYNVRPAGFFEACLRSRRLDLVDALDRGWHAANLAEPVQLSDGTVIGSGRAQLALEEICEKPIHRSRSKR